MPAADQWFHQAVRPNPATRVPAGHGPDEVVRDARGDAGGPGLVLGTLQHEAAPPRPEHERADALRGLQRRDSEEDQAGYQERRKGGEEADGLRSRTGAAGCQPNTLIVHTVIVQPGLSLVFPAPITPFNWSPPGHKCRERALGVPTRNRPFWAP